MALVLRNCFNSYKFLYYEKRDTRLDSWPFMGSPLPVLAIIAAYYYFSTNLGPKLMKNRSAFQIKGLIAVYNVFQILWNSFVAYFALYWTFGQGDFSLRCEDAHFDHTHRQKSVAIATYFYFIAKIIDMLDTVFFIMRKKQQHVSFLHVYHHSIMVFVSYIAVRFLPGGHSALLGILNSIVHVFMYFYYFLTSLTNNIKAIGWWKKLLTQMQMFQFIVLAIHYTQGLFRSCSYPKTAMMVGVIQNVFMFGMFSEFYYNQYVRKQEKKITKHIAGISNDNNNNVDIKNNNNNNNNNIEKCPKNGKTVP